MNFDFKFYLSRFLRRIHYFAVIAIAISALGISLAYILPPVYRAQATLLVESPQIPGDLAASTVEARIPETLRIVQQQLSTRANLLDMSRRLGIHGPQTSLTPDQIVADMRNRILIERKGAFVTVSFAAATAKLSADVTNDIVTQLLQQSVALRTAASGQTLEFFDQQVSRLNDDLARQSQKILTFKLANKDALPDSLDYRRARQGSQQERLLQIDRQLSSIEDRRTKLIDLYERTGQVATDAQAPRSPEEKKLQDVRRQLESALAVYTPQNPRVKVLQAQVQQLEAQVAAQLAAAGDDTSQLSPYELQLSDLDSQIAFQNTQKSEIQAELDSLKISIDDTPANAIQLDVLERDYRAIQTQYSQAIAAQAQAATGDRIEALSKGQRISVVEQAVVPGAPASPNRPLIAAGAVVAGVGLGAAVVLLLEVLNRSIQRPVDLSTRLGVQAFGSVPYIRTAREQMYRRSIISLALLVGLVGIPTTLYALHVYYLPLDLLVKQLLEKTGLVSLGATLGFWS
ncbi:MAG: lipopolysaccharide biosynthesis protein [Cereibacter sphaeroides]|uniref:Lipopolysaccharide biosynthesis protein n=1 Tax=Cereibacter sphaeroides TaxID=1063 RepID=A0A2W5TVV2_CERSP|nr:MAG: lipopolysaccharide biosynthesis protein [Cereibacter sphaeroides]